MTGRFVEELPENAHASEPQSNVSGFGGTATMKLNDRREPMLDMPFPAKFRCPSGKSMVDEVDFGRCPRQGSDSGFPAGDAKPDTDSSVSSLGDTDITFQRLPEPEICCPFVCGPTSVSATLGDESEDFETSWIANEELKRRSWRDQGGAVRMGLFSGKATPNDAHLLNRLFKGGKTDLDLLSCTSPGSGSSKANARMLDTEETQRLSVEESLKQQAMAHLTPRFTLADIAQNPDLAKAAKLELSGHNKMSDETEKLSSCDAQSRATEIEHVRFATDTADRDAERETQIGLEEMDALLKRLATGRRSLEQLLKFVQKLNQANVAYSRSLMNVARSTLSSISSSDSWKCASEGLSELPMVIGGVHSQMSQALAECMAKLQGVLKSMKSLSDGLSSSSLRIQTDVAEKRTAISRALVHHEKVCTAYGALLEHSQSLPNWRGEKSRDPWLTEGHLAAGRANLLEAQYDLRSFLSRSFNRCKEAEANRLQVTKQVMMVILRCHGPCFQQQATPFVNELSRVVTAIDPEHDTADLVISAHAHEDSALVLGAQRKEESLLMHGDLFSSPDIVRQGDLETWDSDLARWVGGHFVLTQAGYLYGFLGNDLEAPVPSSRLCLARCSFEQGDAPMFSITEGGMGWARGWGRIIKLRAPSVEECCEWAIAVREKIASFQGRR